MILMIRRVLLVFLLLSLGQLGLAEELPEQFREPFAKSWPIRERQHLQMKAYLDQLEPRDDAGVEQQFKLDLTSAASFVDSIGMAREQIKSIKGWPPAKAIVAPTTRFELVGQDQHADIYRVWTEVIEGVEAYAIYMVPRGLVGKAPVIIAIHGGSGCPEAVCDLDTRVNYQSFGPDAVKRGYIVYAPGFLMNVSYADPRDPRLPGADWQTLDEQATRLGVSLRDLHTYQFIEGLKAVLAVRPEADSERIGVTGLSMGGGYTLETAAMWPEIKAAACSAGFRGDQENTTKIDELMIGPNAHRSMLIPLICPRPLMIQSGEDDQVVTLESAKAGIPRALAYYQQLGVEDRFEFNVHPGGHVFENDAIFRFFDKHLK